MADDPTSGDDHGAETDAGTDRTPPPGQTFSQDDVSRIATQEARKAARQTRRELAESLGFASIEEMNQAVSQWREADTAALSEVERARQEAETARSEAERLLAEARQDRQAARVQAALAAAGAPEAGLARLAKLVELDPDDDSPDAVKAAVEQVRTDFPGLFAQAPGLPSSEPAGGGAPPSRTETESLAERGKRVAQERLGRRPRPLSI